VHELSEKLSNYLCQQAGNPEKAPVIAYGLQLIIGEFLKLTAIILISFILDLLTPVLLVMSTAVPLRVITGGRHNSSGLRCLITTLLTFPALAALATFLSNNLNILQLLIFAFVTSVFLVLILEKYGPGESVNYREPRVEITEKMKKYAFILVAFWLIAILAFAYLLSDLALYLTIIVSTSLGVLWQGILITPLGHLIVAGSDKLFDAVRIK